MSRITFPMLVLLLICGNAMCATPLNELIDRNVRNANTAYQASRPDAQQAPSPVLLWIHVRTEAQETLAREILNEMTKAQSDKWTLEAKPIQKVESGPSKSQLRYFRKQEQQQAQELLTALRRLVPQLEIADLSVAYENASWIQPGHYELWLAPDLTKLQSVPR